MFFKKGKKLDINNKRIPSIIHFDNPILYCLYDLNSKYVLYNIDTAYSLAYCLNGEYSKYQLSSQYNYNLDEEFNWLNDTDIILETLNKTIYNIHIVLYNYNYPKYEVEEENTINIIFLPDYMDNMNDGEIWNLVERNYNIKYKGLYLLLKDNSHINIADFFIKIMENKIDIYMYDEYFYKMFGDLWYIKYF